MRRIGLVLAFAMVAAGCSHAPPPSIAIGAAPTAATGRIAFPTSYDASGFFPFDHWPKACDLLTDQDLHAILPQISDIRRVPADQALTLLSGGRQAYAKNAMCQIRFSLPGTPKPTDPIVSEIDVSEIAAGSPDVVRLNWDGGNHPQHHRSVAGLDCYTTSDDLNCLKSTLSFRVQPKIQWQRPTGSTDDILRFTRAGKTTTFRGDDDSSGKDYGAALRYQTDNLAPLLATAILAKY